MHIFKWNNEEKQEHLSNWINCLMGIGIFLHVYEKISMIFSAVVVDSIFDQMSKNNVKGNLLIVWKYYVLALNSQIKMLISIEMILKISCVWIFIWMIQIFRNIHTDRLYFYSIDETDYKGWNYGFCLNIFFLHICPVLEIVLILLKVWNI